MIPKRISTGDTIGVVAPSRPIYTIKREINEGIKSLEALGFNVKLGGNLDKHFYYSAGSAKERADDVNSMFADSEVKAVMSATGGISANQILPYIDYELIKNNPKIFIGYSDITNLLLGIYNKTGLVTFHGPDLSDWSSISDTAKTNMIQMLTNKQDKYEYPKVKKIVREGVARGRLVGGNILISNALLGTPYSPDYENAIWFWEAVNESPAKIDFLLNQFKLSGNMNKIRGMIVGHLENCVDNKYPQDNEPIIDIINRVTSGINIPIIMTDFFGHEISNFLTLPVGCNAKIDTSTNDFSIASSPVG